MTEYDMNADNQIAKWKKYFPHRLEKMLKINDITQRDLARMIGITEASMSRYANGERVPKAPIVMAMATALGCLVEELME